MDHILSELRDGILRIEIRRPEKKNAITAAMYSALAAALTQAAQDEAVRVVLIHGQPDGFTAGNDLADFLNNPPHDMDAPAFRFLMALDALPKPLIAAVSGNAIGIGTTMLLHCDLVYAADNARFQLPFATLGLSPEGGSSVLLPRLAGHRRAAEMLMFGEPFDASMALDIGLVNAIHPAEAVLDVALERARKLIALPAAALRQTKRLLKQPPAATIAETMRDEATAFMLRLVSLEAKEAFAAFLEKRKPDFSRFK